jgi:molybdopterin-guanine dinucleotide biosynthesis protein A
MSDVGIVLAGGRSRRFGADKLAVPLGDRTMLDRAVEAVAEVVPQVIVALAPGDDRAIATPTGVSLRKVHDAGPGGGPLLGLVAALEAALEGDVERTLLAGGDMPTLRPAVLQTLLDRLDDPSVDAAAAIVDGRRRPIPCALRARPALAASRTSLGTDDRSLRGMLARLDVTELDADTWRAFDPAGETFRDVDLPDDLPAWNAETGDPGGSPVSYRPRVGGEVSRGSGSR